MREVIYCRGWSLFPQVREQGPSWKGMVVVRRGQGRAEHWCDSERDSPLEALDDAVDDAQAIVELLKLAGLTQRVARARQDG